MLQRLFIFLLLFLVLPDLYLYLRFIVRLTAKWWLRVLYWVPSFLLTAGLLYLVYFANNAFAERHTQDIGWFSIIFFLFTAPKLLLVLFTVLGIPFHKWLRWPRTPFICTGLTLAVLSIVMILYGSFVGRTRFEVKEVTYTSPTPAGFRRLSYCTVIRPSYRQLARKHSCYSEVSGFSECPATRPDCFHRRSGKSPGCRAE